MRFWDIMSNATKKGLLMSIGVDDPRHEALPLTPKLRLTAWGEYLRYGLQIPEDKKIKFIHLEFVEAVWQDAEVPRRSADG